MPIADQVIVELLAKMDKARADVDAYARGFDQRMKQVETSANRAEATLKNFARNALGALGLGLGGQQLKELADAGTRVANNLRVAGLSGESLIAVQEKLFATAQQYGVELEGLSQLYGRVSQAAGELGATQQDLERFTRGVAAAIKVQGAGTQEVRGALIQLSQALGGEIVRAEEFNSINEGARPILQAVAIGIDRFAGSVAALRREVIEGEVSSREFFEGFLRGSADLEERAARSITTVDQAIIKIRNSAIQAISNSEEMQTVLRDLTEAAVRFAENIPTYFREINAGIRTTKRELEALRPLWELIFGDSEGRGGLFRPNITESQRLRNLRQNAEYYEQQAQGGTEFQRALARRRAEDARREFARLAGEIASRPIDLDVRLPTPDYNAVENIDIGAARPTKLTAEQKRALKAAEREARRFAEFVDDVATDNKLTIDELAASGIDDVFEDIADANQEMIDVYRNHENGSRQYREGLRAEAEALKATLDPMVRYRQQAERIAELHSAGLIGDAQAAEGLRRIGHEALLAAETMEGGFARALDVLAQGLESIDVFAGDVFGQIGDAFKAAINQMIAEALRLNVIKPLLGSVFGRFGGGTGPGLLGALFGGFRAGGGPVEAGRAYIVGERGPELMVPAGAGTVIPNGRLAAAAPGRTVVQHISVDARNSVTPENFARQIIGLANQQAAAMDVEVLRGARQAMPGQLDRMNRLGTP